MRIKLQKQQTGTHMREYWSINITIRIDLSETSAPFWKPLKLTSELVQSYKEQKHINYFDTSIDTILNNKNRCFPIDFVR